LERCEEETVKFLEAPDLLIMNTDVVRIGDSITIAVGRKGPVTAL